jgi:predicted nucleotidyltransferase
LSRLSLIRESEEFKDRLAYLRTTEIGSKLGFAALAREVIRELSGDDSLVLKPNDTLAIEYIRALRSRNSSILPYPIKRIGDGYENESPEHPSITSASALRPLLTLQNINKCSRYIEAEALSPLLTDLESGHAPVRLSQRLSDAILAFFIAFSDGNQSFLERSGDAEGELVRRLALAARDSLDLDDLLRRVSTRSHTDAYVRRVLLRTFLGVTSSETRSPVSYTRVLGFSDRGRAILRVAKRNGSVSLLTKTADYSSLPTHAARQAARSLAADRFCFMAMPVPRPVSDAYRGTPCHIRSDSAE